MKNTLEWTRTKYGVTESKKRTLDALTIQVLDATDQVSQLQSIVNSLTQKLATYQAFVTQSEASKTQSSSNLILLDTVIKNAQNLRDSSAVALEEVLLANIKTESVAKSTTSVINKLIYTAEMINKLSGLIIRRKAQNPLISDQLISMVTAAGTSANNAVALTLVALNATFAAQSTNKETSASAGLESLQAEKLFSKLTVDEKTNSKNLSIKTLLENAYTESEKEYKKMQNACGITLKQLNQKTADLSKAQINLKSLQSGLAAANAAALAS
jgi:hypothetical protein